MCYVYCCAVQLVEELLTFWSLEDYEDSLEELEEALIVSGVVVDRSGGGASGAGAGSVGVCVCGGLGEREGRQRTAGWQQGGKQVVQ